MPPKESSPPKAMTWLGASLALAVAAVFDLLRIIFEQFWFFGPALAATYCASKVSGVVGTAVGGTLCSAGAAAVGFLGFAPLAAFGVVMAMAVGLFGWMVLGLILMLTNRCMFKEEPVNTVWFLASLGASEVPFIGTIPALSIATFKMYWTQIKKEKKALKKWEAAHAAEQKRVRGQQQQQAAQIIQNRNLQEAQAANDDELAAENADEEIPEELQRAA